jgi:hypothetical protein
LSLHFRLESEPAHEHKISILAGCVGGSMTHMKLWQVA